MQNFSNILTQFDDMGLVFSLGENNLLKVTPKEKITDQTRLFIREHKAEIIDIMTRQDSAKVSTDIQSGCMFHGESEQYVSGTKQLRHTQQPEKRGRVISLIALKWLREHRQELRQVGWTGRELYRRNKSPGICWCGLWEEPFLKVYLHDNGVIEFECVIADKDIIQTARPMHRARKN